MIATLPHQIPMEPAIALIQADQVKPGKLMRISATNAGATIAAVSLISSATAKRAPEKASQGHFCFSGHRRSGHSVQSAVPMAGTSSIADTLNLKTSGAASRQ